MTDKEEVLKFLERCGLGKDKVPKAKKVCKKTPHMLCDNCGDCKKEKK